jgi:hypothetical protein
MKRSRFSEERIITVLKEPEAGMATAEVCRRHGLAPVAALIQPGPRPVQHDSDTTA